MTTMATFSLVIGQRVNVCKVISVSQRSSDSTYKNEDIFKDLALNRNCKIELKVILVALMSVNEMCENLMNVNMTIAVFL